LEYSFLSTFKLELRNYVVLRRKTPETVIKMGEIPPGTPPPFLSDYFSIPT